eukprot:5513721-Alexandrium_andersonii.AAC.1
MARAGPPRPACHPMCRRTATESPSRVRKLRSARSWQRQAARTKELRTIRARISPPYPSPWGLVQGRPARQPRWPADVTASG